MNERTGQRDPEEQDQEDAQHEEPGIGEAHGDGGRLNGHLRDEPCGGEQVGVGFPGGQEVERHDPGRDCARDDEVDGGQEDHGRLPFSGGRTIRCTA